MWRRLLCRWRGHRPTVTGATATIPGVKVTSECRRCGQYVTADVPLKIAQRLRLVQGGQDDAA